MRTLEPGNWTWARRRGFTLVELLLVLLILAVLAAVVVPKFTGRSEEAKITAAKTQISMFDTALDLFENDNGRFPTTDEGLKALIEAPAGLNNWHSGYMKQDALPNDPWGNPYQYRNPGTKNANSYDLFSTGPDGRESTDDIWPR